MAEYDLTQRISSYLDKQLINKILEHLEATQIYPNDVIFRLQAEVLKYTKLIDSRIDVYNKLNTPKNDPIYKDLEEEKERVMDSLGAEVGQFIEFLCDPEQIDPIRTTEKFNMDYICAEYDFEPEEFQHLQSFTKTRYDTAHTSEAVVELMKMQRDLTVDEDGKISVLWGILAMEIQLGTWGQRTEEAFVAIRSALDSKLLASQLPLLEQRAWALHWALFVYFNSPSGVKPLCELFLSEKFAAVIQTECPHLLRYLCAAALLCRDQSPPLKDIMNVVANERYSYMDPLTEFMHSLYKDLDFKAALSLLEELPKVIGADYFLAPEGDKLLRNAKQFYFDTFCRVHCCLDMSEIERDLGLDREDIEQCVRDMDKRSQISAKIDSVGGEIIVTPKVNDIYRQVMDKTASFAFRTTELINGIEERFLEKKPIEEPEEEPIEPEQAAREARAESISVLTNTYSNIVWAATRVFNGAEYIGEILVNFLGLDDSKYQYVVDSYFRNQRELQQEKIEEGRAIKAQEDLMAEEQSDLEAGVAD